MALQTASLPAVYHRFTGECALACSVPSRDSSQTTLILRGSGNDGAQGTSSQDFGPAARRQSNKYPAASQDDKNSDDRKRKGPPQSQSCCLSLRQTEALHTAKQHEIVRLQKEQAEIRVRLWVLEQVAATRDAWSGAGVSNAVRHAAGDPFVQLGYSPEDMMRASPQKVLEMWKALQIRLGRALLEATTGSVAAQYELQSLTSGVAGAFQHMAYVRPDLLMFSGLHLDSILHPGSFTACVNATPAPPEDHWRKVALAAGLGASSLARCHVLKQLVEVWLKDIFAERQALSAVLNTLAADAGINRYLGQPPLVSNSLRATPGPVAGLPMEAPEENTLKRLQINLRKERNIHMLVMVVLHTRILASQESAQVLMQSYPYMLDVMALLQQLSLLHLANVV